MSSSAHIPAWLEAETGKRGKAVRRQGKVLCFSGAFWREAGVTLAAFPLGRLWLQSRRTVMRR
jgi:hypothetical protein